MSIQVDSKIIKAEALRLGFSACGVAHAEPVDEDNRDRMDRWTSEGRMGTMDYMNRYRDIRLDPRLLMEDARSIVSVALNYYPGHKLSDDQYQFSWYAYGKDYHEVLSEKLHNLLLALRSATGLGEQLQGRVCCDTAPILERYWAWRAGLGWIGRNTQFIIPRQGSCFFLGELLLNAESQYDQPMLQQCGTCTRCLDACPTHAIELEATKPCGLHADRCLNYWSIENRGEIPEQYAEKMGEYVYGCDRCLKACPHNSHCIATNIDSFAPSQAFLDMMPDEWQHLSVERYRELFKGSAVKRAKYEGLMRNIHIAEDSGKQKDKE